ncbi:acetylglutamate kinase [Chloroflexota bacterium]
MNKVIVIKLGGSTLGNHDTAIEDIVELQRRGKSLVVVHGGGKLITEWLDKQGISSRFVQGERVTDQATLDIVISVLAGLINKGIVAAINDRGGQAAGISGADGALIEGRIGNKEKGYVGEVARVNTAILKALMESAFIPVVAPVGLNASERPTGTSAMLNFNADIIAGEIAAATGAERLVFLTDVAGICDQSGKLLPRLSPAEAEALVASGVASGGMIPKIKACLTALSHAATPCIIDGRQSHALLKSIEGKDEGTRIGVKE